MMIPITEKVTLLQYKNFHNLESKEQPQYKMKYRHLTADAIFNSHTIFFYDQDQRKIMAFDILTQSWNSFAEPQGKKKKKKSPILGC